MSEITSSENFNTPQLQDFDTLGFQGSMQQILSENIGSYVLVDFLIGTGNLVTRQGHLYYVGSQFLVLYDEVYLNYIVCDIFAVKFVTFLMPGCREFNPKENVITQMERSMNSAASPAVDLQQPQTQVVPPAADPTMTQAAYAHAVRRPVRAPLNGRTV